MSANLKHRRRKKIDVPAPTADPGACEFIEGFVWSCSREDAEKVVEALANLLDPGEVKSIAYALGWCETCQGERTVEGVYMREYPCPECA